MTMMRNDVQTRPQQITDLIGNSEVAVQMRKFVHLVAPLRHNVLLTGETGAGKDHLAEYIHHVGGKYGRFIPVHCASLPDNLIESELFGHVRGAFTDAVKEKQGLVQDAEGGTLFLNEIDSIPLHRQGKLLRLLEGKSYRQVGGNREFSVQTRIIVGTNVNLQEAVARKKIRADLFFRLNNLTYEVPPLRERREDILVLAQHFLKQEEMGAGKKFSDETIVAMTEYDWPGNIRQLSAAVQRSAVFSGSRPVIELSDIKPCLVKFEVTQSSAQHPFLPEVSVDDWPTFQEVRTEYFRRLLVKTHGNILKTSRLANLPAATVYRILDKLGLKEFVKSLRHLRS